jgi:hypothetical protein
MDTTNLIGQELDLYKLTDREGYTRRFEYNQMYWKVGEKNYASGPGNELCSPGVLHAYLDPYMAILLNSIHAGFNPDSMRMFKVKGTIVAVEDQFKVGTKTLTVMEEIIPPTINWSQRIEIAMRLMLNRLDCDTKVSNDKTEELIKDYLGSPDYNKLIGMYRYYYINGSKISADWFYSFYQCIAYPDSRSNVAVFITDSLRTEFPNDDIDVIKIIHEVVDRPMQES